MGGPSSWALARDATNLGTCQYCFAPSREKVWSRAALLSGHVAASWIRPLRRHAVRPELATACDLPRITRRQTTWQRACALAPLDGPLSQINLPQSAEPRGMQGSAGATDICRDGHGPWQRSVIAIRADQAIVTSGGQAAGAGQNAGSEPRLTTNLRFFNFMVNRLRRADSRDALARSGKKDDTFMLAAGECGLTVRGVQCTVEASMTGTFLFQ